MTISVFSKPKLPLQARMSSGTYPDPNYTTTALDDHHHHQQKQQHFMINHEVGETSSYNGDITNNHLQQHQTLSTSISGSASLDKRLSFADEVKHASVQQLQFLGENNNLEKCNNVVEITAVMKSTNKRKRPRTAKTSEEVESQRMIHIAVERNRRKQMNEHLTVLRSLMPASYVQRGDQASIIGGAIEFVRELEQLLQCLESQKRRRICEDENNGLIIPMGDLSLPSTIPMEQQTPFLLPMALPCDDDNDQMRQLVDYETAGVLLQEETAESKSCLADVQVKILGVDGIIRILSRPRPGQLINTIAALEDMQLNILHTNITTIEQTVLYSFNVKVGAEARAEDIAHSVQQILSLIHANNIMSI